MIHMVKINRTLTFQGKRQYKYDYCIEFILHLFNILHKITDSQYSHFSIFKS